MKNLRSTLGIVISLVLAVVLVGAGYYFLFQQIETVTTHTSDVQNQIEEATGREGYLLSLKTMLTDSKGEINVLDARIIPKDGEVAFLDRLEGLGRFAGVKLTTDAFGLGSVGDMSAGLFQQVGVSVSVDGSYSSVRYFLSLLETLPYSLTLSSVSLERAGASGKASWHGSFKITALIHK
ncbi:MAG: hypothetical protein RLZZ347_675 [Candidatus Parcubacteria bacterium]|jgi:Tfp pilus assembly protein PilO